MRGFFVSAKPCLTKLCQLNDVSSDLCQLKLCKESFDVSN